MISSAGLYYAFDQVNLFGLWYHLKSVKFTWLILSVLLLIFSVAIRAVRWQFLIEPVASIRFHPLFAATMIGYFGNAVLPLRLGELLRAYTISKKQNIDASSAFGTVILERVLDMLGLIITILIFGWFYSFDENGKNIIFTVIIFTLVCFVLIIALGHVQFHLMKKIQKWTIFKKLWALKVLNILKSLVKGMTSLRSTKHIGQIILHTIFLWLIYFAITYTVTISVGININWIAMGVVLIFTSLAFAIPAAPGGLGTYHAAAVYVLTTFFYIGRLESQAFAIILHAVGFLPLVIIGAIYFFRSSISIKDFTKESLPE